jgi:hypothetical protein
VEALKENFQDYLPGYCCYRSSHSQRHQGGIGAVTGAAGGGAAGGGTGVETTEAALGGGVTAEEAALLLKLAAVDPATSP